MRPIKFRGRNIKTGKIHYGFYSEYPVGGGRIETCIIDKYMDGWEVEPESVAQLVGYDADGKEIYSDDKVIDSSGKELFFKDVSIKFSEIGGKFDDLTLKG